MLSESLLVRDFYFIPDRFKTIAKINFLKKSNDISLEMSRLILRDKEDAFSILSLRINWFLKRNICFISGVTKGGSLELMVIVLSG